VFDDAPSGDESVYLEEGEYETRQSISAKYVFYALAEISDTLLEQYPPVYQLNAKKQDPEFKAKLRRALAVLLSALRRRAMAVCRARKLRIAKVGLTIPVQWTLEFEEIYRGLVAEVFEIQQEIIYFFTETEALARYLFKYKAAQMDPEGKHNTVLFFDFGGHNMACVHLLRERVLGSEANSAAARTVAPLGSLVMKKMRRGMASIALERSLVRSPLWLLSRTSRLLSEHL
jgi:hypothetical protein